MSRYRKIEYIKCVGCHHDDNDELTGGIEIPMVALFDSDNIDEKTARRYIECDEENAHIMLISQTHYDNILKPAFQEYKQDASKKELTRDEAVEILRTKPNIKISHTLFEDDEYLYMKNGQVFDENGYLFEDWHSPAHNGVRMRVGGMWDTGWSIKENA